MAEMKLYELVNHYHIGTELTCAEAMFMACNEYYHLNLSEETRKMFSVMGLGMQTEQSCCGAFTVAVGIIGLMTAKEGQTDVDNMEGYEMISELTDFMLGFYGTLHCMELQRLEITGFENPCHAIVEALAKKLEELLADLSQTLNAASVRMVASALDTVGVIYEEYDTYRARFPEEPEAYRSRRERLLGNAMPVECLSLIHISEPTRP